MTTNQSKQAEYPMPVTTIKAGADTSAAYFEALARSQAMDSGYWDSGDEVEVEFEGPATVVSDSGDGVLVQFEDGEALHVDRALLSWR